MIPLSKMLKMRKQKSAVACDSAADTECTKENPLECKIHGVKALSKTDEIDKSSHEDLDSLMGMSGNVIEGSKSFKAWKIAKEEYDSACESVDSLTESQKRSSVGRDVLKQYIRARRNECELRDKVSKIAIGEMRKLFNVKDDTESAKKNLVMGDDRYDADDILSIGAFVLGLCGKKSKPSHSAVCATTDSMRNGMERDASSMYLHGGITATELAHELGHYIEGANEEVHKRCVDFLERRCKGCDTETVGIEESEKGRKDKFLDAYMGKDYIDDKGNRYATEILSMWLQHFVFMPHSMYEKDKEYFMFGLNVLKGE